MRAMIGIGVVRRGFLEVLPKVALMAEPAQLVLHVKAEAVDLVRNLFECHC